MKISNSYPRESVEFQPVTVTVDGVPVTAGVEFALVVEGARPVTWVASVDLAGKIGVMVTGLVPGQYHVWAKVTSSPEAPVIDCGAFLVT